MPRCPECGRLFDTQGLCQRCDQRHGSDSNAGARDAAIDAADDWRTVARFGNAAEAGYFANELEFAIGCEPRLVQRDDFDAAHHFWRTSYVLSVPEQLAELAATQLRRILDGEPGEAAALTSRELPRQDRRREFGYEPTSADAGTPSGINWVPIVLTLAAGSLVLWAGKKQHAPRRPAAPDDAQRVDIWDALDRDQLPWVQRSNEGNGGVRELVVDAASGQALLREDRDGDGVFESETRYDTGRR
jgi:hypothetical protein